MVTRTRRAQDFSDFVVETEPRVRRALVAAFGPDVGTDAAADAMAVAWEEWELVKTRPNPAGYLWGVGRNCALKRLRGNKLFPAPEPSREPWIEPGLPAAVEELSEQQRMAVLLVHGFGWTFREVAELLDVTISTVQTHLDRGMAKLRQSLGVDP